MAKTQMPQSFKSPQCCQKGLETMEFISSRFIQVWLVGVGVSQRDQMSQVSQVSLGVKGSEGSHAFFHGPIWPLMDSLWALNASKEVANRKNDCKPDLV